MARRIFSGRLVAKKSLTSLLKARSSAVSKTSISSLAFSNGCPWNHQGVDRHRALRPGDQWIDIELLDQVAEARRQHREAGDAFGKLLHIDCRPIAVALEQRPQ